MAKQPLHLAIIPDGNRRWARAHALQPWKGHEQAVENFRIIIDWSRKNPHIGTLTLWCFSTENWKRDTAEVSKLMEMLEQYLRNERDALNKNRTRLVHSGRRDRIPSSLATLLQEIMDETAAHDGFTLHLALDYGGKDEILRAISRFINTSKPRNLKTPEPPDLRPFLDQPNLPDLDIIVRTSGEQRTSNFFLWQSAYAEWFFLEKYFPDLSVEDLENVLKEYSERKRRFGS